jgi:hypothetical protein
MNARKHCEKGLTFCREFGMISACFTTTGGTAIVIELNSQRREEMTDHD